MSAPALIALLLLAATLAQMLTIAGALP